jgi:hypothetical protein
MASESHAERTTPSAKLAAGRRKCRPLSQDDSIFQLIGMLNDPGSAGVSSDKYAALGEKRPQSRNVPRGPTLDEFFVVA